ncbi:MAG: tRNA pseudouridine(55) synthase TruB [Solirubrobacterales bacterium]
MATAAERAAVLACDKPAGITSHDLVAQVRRERKLKVGHAGTLDPFATGLLLVLLGPATRLQRYLMALPKTYRATARLGWRSSTGDPEGELSETGRIPGQLALPTGLVRQRLPMTSAVKVAGERLYRRAHRGERVETPEREVEVMRAELIDSGEDTASYEIECSSGTYVRTLIETLGDAYCESLRRVAIGPITIEQAGTELTPNEALAFMPEYRLDESEAKAVSHGQAIGAGDWVLGSGPEPDAPAPSTQHSVVRLTQGDALLAVARLGDDTLKPEVVLA